MNQHDIPLTLAVSYERLRDIRRGRDREYGLTPDRKGVFSRTTGAIYAKPKLADPALIRASFGQMLAAKRPLSRSEIKRALQDGRSFDAIEKVHATLQFGDFFNAELVPYAIDGDGKPIVSKKIRDEMYFVHQGKFYAKKDRLAHRGKLYSTQRGGLYGAMKRGNRIGKQQDGIYMGVELETGIKDEDLPKLFYATAGFTDMKHDGSLDHFGVELSTRPMPYHLLKKKWKKFFRTMDGFLEDEPNGGVHVHITYPEPPATKAMPEMIRNLFFFIHSDMNYGMMVKIGRRKGSERYSKYAHAKNFHESNRVHDGGDKYQAIANRTNTLEFRLFKTTRKYSIMMTYLEFVRASVDFAKLGHKDEASLHWRLFAKYLKKRKDNFPNVFKVVNEYAAEQGVTL